MKNGGIQIHTENKTTKRAKMSCINARLQYLQGGYKASEATSRATLFCFTLAVFLADVLDSPFRFFV